MWISQVAPEVLQVERLNPTPAARPPRKERPPFLIDVNIEMVRKAIHQIEGFSHLLNWQGRVPPEYRAIYLQAQKNRESYGTPGNPGTKLHRFSASTIKRLQKQVPYAEYVTLLYQIVAHARNRLHIRERRIPAYNVEGTNIKQQVTMAMQAAMIGDAWKIFKWVPAEQVPPAIPLNALDGEPGV